MCVFFKNQQAADIRKLLSERITDKHEFVMAKLGAIMGHRSVAQQNQNKTKKKKKKKTSKFKFQKVLKFCGASTSKQGNPKT